MYATKDATAKSAAKALTEHVGRYGQPSQILSDNGTQYANAVIKELLKLLGTQQLHYKTYSNEETSIAECANKEVTFTCSLQYLKEIQIQSGLKAYQ
jgi:hypothetical protein